MGQLRVIPKRQRYLGDRWSLHNSIYAKLLLYMMGMCTSMPQQKIRNVNQGRKQRNNSVNCDTPVRNRGVRDVAQSNMECKAHDRDEQMCVIRQISRYSDVNMPDSMVDQPRNSSNVANANLKTKESDCNYSKVLENAPCQPDFITCCKNVATFLAKAAAANSNKSAFATPTAEYIYSYMRFLFAIMQLEPEVCVYADIYCRRLLSNTRGTLKIHAENWYMVLVGCCLLASKYMDDMSMHNGDFSAALTGCSVQFMNTLEAQFVHILNWQLHVPISQYKKRYVELASRQDGVRNWDVDIEKVKQHFTMFPNCRCA